MTNNNQSAVYLKNNGIREGDLFLFFGNFHRVRNIGGHFEYIKKTGDFYKDKDLQVIWGYLQVGEIIDDPIEQGRLWWHPHSSENRRNNKTNVIFRASKKLSFDDSKPGAGLLSFRLDRVLTSENCNKATWKKNPIYDVKNIMGNRKNSSKDPDRGIYYAGIWQELCLAETEECTDWARSLIINENGMGRA